MKIKALRDITHAGDVHPAGDEFDVSDADGAYYTAMRRKIMAVTADDRPMNAPLPSPPVAEGERVKRKYVRKVIEPAEPVEPVKPAEPTEPVKPDEGEDDAEKTRQYQRRDMTAEE